jgi:hypothetical protein
MAAAALLRRKLVSAAHSLEGVGNSTLGEVESTRVLALCTSTDICSSSRFVCVCVCVCHLSLSFSLSLSLLTIHTHSSAARRHRMCV